MFGLFKKKSKQIKSKQIQNQNKIYPPRVEPDLSELLKKLTLFYASLIGNLEKPTFEDINSLSINILWSIRLSNDDKNKKLKNLSELKTLLVDSIKTETAPHIFAALTALETIGSSTEDISTKSQKNQPQTPSNLNFIDNEVAKKLIEALKPSFENNQLSKDAIIACGESIHKLVKAHRAYDPKSDDASSPEIYRHYNAMQFFKKENTHMHQLFNLINSEFSKLVESYYARREPLRTAAKKELSELLDRSKNPPSFMRNYALKRFKA